MLSGLTNLALQPAELVSAVADALTLSEARTGLLGNSAVMSVGDTLTFGETYASPGDLHPTVNDTLTLSDTTTGVSTASVRALAHDYESNAYSSTANGTTWTARTFPGAETMRATVFNGQAFFGIGTFSAGNFYRSNDGLSWSLVSTLPSGSYTNLCAGADGRLVATSSTGSAVSTDGGVTWETGLFPTTGSAVWNADIGYGNGLFCAIGLTAGNVMYSATSSDGKTWTRSTTKIHAAASVDSIFQASPKWAGSNFVVSLVYIATVANYLYSPDGQSWTQVAHSGGGVNLTSSCLAYNGSEALMLCSGNGNPGGYKGISSDGGATWTVSTVSFSGSGLARSVRWSSTAGLWLVNANFSNTIFTSPTAATWTSRTATNAGNGSMSTINRCVSLYQG